jgi:FtsP/CotA-like multicopper oxidase with cupredoxin domain
VESRRQFLKNTAIVAGAMLLPAKEFLTGAEASPATDTSSTDYTLHIDFVADNPGLTLFHCHQQLHMDFGFMTLFDYSG